MWIKLNKKTKTNFTNRILIKTQFSECWLNWKCLNVSRHLPLFWRDASSRAGMFISTSMRKSTKSIVMGYHFGTESTNPLWTWSDLTLICKTNGESVKTWIKNFCWFKTVSIHLSSLSNLDTSVHFTVYPKTLNNFSESSKNLIDSVWT